MTKSQLISVIAEKNQIKKKDAEVIVCSIIDTITDTLVNGDKVSISGFGTFEVRPRAEKKAISPVTKEQIIVPAKKAPTFKAGKTLKELVNN